VEQAVHPAYAQSGSAFEGSPTRIVRPKPRHIRNDSASERRARLEGRADERLRIARELHDTLLQQFQVLLVMLPVARKACRAHPEETERLLDSALSQAEVALAESREVIQNMCRATDCSDLAQAFRETAEEFESEAATQFRAFAEGRPRDLHPVVRHEVYRIACEAIRNAFKHAEAELVEAEIHYGDGLRLRIRDNGKGIESDTEKLPKTACSGHFGISGMRERACEIGAKLTIWSAPRAGTEVELIIPGPIAYETPRQSLAAGVMRFGAGLMRALVDRFDADFPERRGHRDRN